jgi:lipopolysaccharide export system ATP-binding protein
MSILQAKNLSKSYKGRMVVRDVSIEISSKEIIGLLGPNGAGKTTSFYIMVGLITPDNGKVLLNDKDITDLPMHSRARLGLGYLPQEASVFRKMTVMDNIMAVLELRKELTPKQRTEKQDSLLEEFHIGHIRHNKGFSLSGGERRRVEIARALAMEPEFILLDEPFAGIDPISVIDIKRIITHLAQRGIGVLITDHNVRETLDICEKAYILSEGRVIATGDAKAIMANQQVRDVYLGEEFDI